MKKLFKTITSAILSAVMPLSLTSAAFADASAYVPLPTDAEPIEFIDVPTTHWAHDIIEKATVKHLLNGYQTDIRKKVEGGWGWEYEFKPENTMTKVEFLTVVGRELTLWDGYTSVRQWLCRTNAERDTFTSKFNPALPDWSVPFIQTAYQTYVINTDDAEFANLNEPITRADIAKILSRCEIGRKMMRETSPKIQIPFEIKELEAWYEDKYAPDTQHLIHEYSENQIKMRNDAMINADTKEIAKRIVDWNTIPKTHQGYVANVYEKGIVNGYEDGTFKPNAPVTRAEAATMLVKFREYIYAPGVQDR